MEQGITRTASKPLAAGEQRYQQLPAVERRKNIAPGDIEFELCHGKPTAMSLLPLEQIEQINVRALLRVDQPLRKKSDGIRMVHALQPGQVLGGDAPQIGKRQLLAERTAADLRAASRHRGFASAIARENRFGVRPIVIVREKDAPFERP